LTHDSDADRFASSWKTLNGHEQDSFWLLCATRLTPYAFWFGMAVMQRKQSNRSDSTRTAPVSRFGAFADPSLLEASLLACKHCSLSLFSRARCGEEWRPYGCQRVSLSSLLIVVVTINTPCGMIMQTRPAQKVALRRQTQYLSKERLAATSKAWSAQRRNVRRWHNMKKARKESTVIVCYTSIYKGLFNGSQSSIFDRGLFFIDWARRTFEYCWVQSSMSIVCQAVIAD